MYLPLAFLFCLLPLLSAAPATSNTPAVVSSHGAAIGSPSFIDTGSTAQDLSTEVSATPSQVQKGSTPASSTTTHSSVHKPTVGTTKHHVVKTTAQPHTGGQITQRPNSTTRTFVPGPVPSHSHPKPPPHHQSDATLVFEILGALAGVIFILSVVRCVYSYSRTPSHDRITAILHRHQLQREMEELERNPPDHRRSLVAPPPPYVAPPAYPDDESTPLSDPNRGNVSYGEDPRTPPSAFRPNG